MRTFIVVVFLFIVSCTAKPEKTNFSKKVKDTVFIKKETFQFIIDSSKVKGSILIYDYLNNSYYSNNFSWSKKGFLPASTFKIPNSIIALETGIIKNDSTIIPWNGEKRNMKIWEQDLTLKKAFHLSCVPCYQKIAREIGVLRMNKFLDSLNYKSMNVNQTSIGNFWLQGNSKINQFQQIDFLKRFHFSELPISKSSEITMKRLMIISKNNNSILRGKTGWSIRNGNNNGWFVGYLQKEKKLYFFATNIKPNKDFDLKKFSKIRKEITLKALSLIDKQ